MYILQDTFPVTPSYFYIGYVFIEPYCNVLDFKGQALGGSARSVGLWIRRLYVEIQALTSVGPLSEASKPLNCSGI